MTARRRRVIVASLGLLVLTAAGCSSGETKASQVTAFEAPETVTVDVGLDKPLTIEKGAKLRIAMFGATGNAWLNALNSTADEVAEKSGASIKHFASQYDAQKQSDQVSSATSSGDYDAFIITAWDSNLICGPVRRAAEAGILVVVTPNPVCGKELEEWGPGAVAPGVFSLVNSEQSITYGRAWLKAIAERLPANSKVAIVVGPETDTLAKSVRRVVGDTLGQRRDVKIVDYVYGDFTAPTALTKVQDLLSANPDITDIITATSDPTRGVIQAIKQAGLQGKVRVYDSGAAKSSIQAIKDGQLTLTIPKDPVGGATDSVEALVSAYRGEKVPRFIDTFPKFTGGSVTKPLVIDSSNVGKYDARY